MRNRPIGEQVIYFDKHPGDLEKCELIRPYSRSQYHDALSQIYTKVLQQIIIWAEGDEAVNDTKIFDSGGFGIARYRDWYNAKYGKLSVKDFAKLYAIYTPQGKICAATVTSGDISDSPYLIEDDAKRFR